jgi:hypothetical protein
MAQLAPRFHWPRYVRFALIAAALCASPRIAAMCHKERLRAVDGKVVVRKQGSHLPMSEKHGQEFARHLGFEQPVAVLREHRRHPNSIIHAKTDKPAIEQIVM